ncbi:MAG: endopeptidase La, partial [Nitrospira sp.]|nr:endopeptidase La [Nitrospira sp.]
AAKRAKLSTVILPKRNKKDLEEIPKHLLKGIELVFVETVDDVIKAALRRTAARPARRTSKKPAEKSARSTPKRAAGSSKRHFHPSAPPRPSIV